MPSIGGYSATLPISITATSMSVFPYRRVLGKSLIPSAHMISRKSKNHEISVNFLVFDALKLQLLQTKFDTVIDCGLFHVFSDEERLIFAASLSSALHPGGRYFMLCFSEHEPGSYGSRRVTQAEIRATFGKGWKINYIREAEFETMFATEGMKAWLSSITRL